MTVTALSATYRYWGVPVGAEGETVAGSVATTDLRDWLNRQDAAGEWELLYVFDLGDHRVGRIDAMDDERRVWFCAL